MPRNRPRMSCSQNLSPLGTFRKLPPETRCNIWRFLMPSSMPPSPHQTYIGELEDFDRSDIYKRPESRLSILCASRELYEEVSNQLYGRELCFYICVGMPGFGIKHDHSSMSYYKYTPLHRFRNIAIEIRAPADSSGPGRILRGMDSVMDIVKFIIFQAHPKSIAPAFLHQIDIRFVNGAGTTWSRAGGCWQQSVPECLILDNDYFLGPFRLLSNLGSLKIHVPDEFGEYQFVTNSIRDVTTSMWSPRYHLRNLKRRWLRKEYYRLDEKYFQIPCEMRKC